MRHVGSGNVAPANVLRTAGVVARDCGGAARRGKGAWPCSRAPDDDDLGHRDGGGTGSDHRSHIHPRGLDFAAAKAWRPQPACSRCLRRSHSWLPASSSRRGLRDAVRVRRFNGRCVALAVAAVVGNVPGPSLPAPIIAAIIVIQRHRDNCRASSRAPSADRLKL